jgi:hypothetical protein
MHLLRCASHVTHLALAQVLASGLAAQVAPASAPLTLESRVGLVTYTPAGVPCLAIHNRDLHPGTAVGLVLTPVVGEHGAQLLFRAQVRSASAGACSTDSTVEIRSYGDTAYALSNIPDRLPARAILFGVVAAPSQFAVHGNLVTVALRPDVPAARFRICTSNEGIHLTIWSGEPLRSARIWHEYVHFDFDTDPRCDKAEYSEPG